MNRGKLFRLFYEKKGSVIFQNEYEDNDGIDEKTSNDLSQLHSYKRKRKRNIKSTCLSFIILLCVFILSITSMVYFVRLNNRVMILESQKEHSWGALESRNSVSNSHGNWKQCVWRYEIDISNGRIMTCSFKKKINGSSLRIFFEGEYHVGYCADDMMCCKRWFFKINGSECTQPATIEGVLRGSKGILLIMQHSYHIEGYCDNVNNGFIDVELWVEDCYGNNDESVTGGVDSVSRIIVEEVAKGQEEETFSTECGNMWNFHNGSCYFFSKEKMNWKDSGDFCTGHDGNLVSIHSEQENTYVLREMEKRNIKAFFIGLNDIVKEGEFQWIDGTDQNFDFWKDNKKDNFEENEHCVQYVKTNTWVWNDINCLEKFKFVCKKLI